MLHTRTSAAAPARDQAIAPAISKTTTREAPERRLSRGLPDPPRETATGTYRPLRSVPVRTACWVSDPDSSPLDFLSLGMAAVWRMRRILAVGNRKRSLHVLPGFQALRRGYACDTKEVRWTGSGTSGVRELHFNSVALGLSAWTFTWPTVLRSQTSIDGCGRPVSCAPMGAASRSPSGTTGSLAFGAWQRTMSTTAAWGPRACTVGRRTTRPID